MHIDRITLYEQVWTTPMSRLCKTYGLSDVGLAKICEQHQVPRPPRGYWEKKRNGKPVRRKPLPPLADSRLEKVDLEPRPADETIQEVSEVDRLVAAEREEGARIIVATTLEDPHPLISRTMISLRAARPDKEGLVRPRAKGCLDVTVGPASIDRAMLILDSLIKGLEARSFRVVAPAGETAGSRVELHGESVRFCLNERADRIARALDESKMDRIDWMLGPRVEYVYSPSGELALHIVHSGHTIFRHSWRDGAKKRLEDWLNSFVVGLIRVALGMEDERREAERQRLEAERRRKEWEEAEQRRKEQERLRREEEERVRQLGASLDVWIRVRNLRSMIAEVRERAGCLSREIPPDSHVGRWLELAERTAARLDPLRELLSELPAAVERTRPDLEIPSA